jgi:hypothetical protein
LLEEKIPFQPLERKGKLLQLQQADNFSYTDGVKYQNTVEDVDRAAVKSQSCCSPGLDTN